MSFPPSKYPPAHDPAAALLSQELDTQVKRTIIASPLEHRTIAFRNGFA